MGSDSGGGAGRGRGGGGRGAGAGGAGAGGGAEYCWGGGGGGGDSSTYWTWHATAMAQAPTGAPSARSRAPSFFIEGLFGRTKAGSQKRTSAGASTRRTRRWGLHIERMSNRMSSTLTLHPWDVPVTEAPTSSVGTTRSAASPVGAPVRVCAVPCVPLTVMVADLAAPRSTSTVHGSNSSSLSVPTVTTCVVSTAAPPSAGVVLSTIATTVLNATISIV